MLCQTSLDPLHTQTPTTRPSWTDAHNAVHKTYGGGERRCEGGSVRFSPTEPANFFRTLSKRSLFSQGFARHKKNQKQDVAAAEWGRADVKSTGSKMSYWAHTYSTQTDIWFEPRTFCRTDGRTKTHLLLIVLMCYIVISKNVVDILLVASVFLSFPVTHVKPPSHNNPVKTPGWTFFDMLRKKK